MSSCHGCAQSFGVFKREQGCPKCGFSYCKKCLRFKIVDTNTKKDLLVCHRCHALITTNMDLEEPPVITTALKRLESMENPSKPPITLYRQPAREARLAQLKKGLSIEDQHIAERLECLRKPDEGANTIVGQRRRSEKLEEDIEARLARLKGEEPSVGRRSLPIVGKSKPETEIDLIARYCDEVKLDKQYDAQVVSDIESRLAKLHGAPSQATSSSEVGGKTSTCDIEDEDVSEEEQVKRIIERFKAEVELEAKSIGTDSMKTGCPTDQDEQENVSQDVIMPSESDDDDESLDNLCRICDGKRATLKCEECDGDLFCKNCFNELHNELGEVHKPTPFKK